MFKASDVLSIVDGLNQKMTHISVKYHGSSIKAVGKYVGKHKITGQERYYIVFNYGQREIIHDRKKYRDRLIKCNIPPAEADRIIKELEAKG